MNGLLSQKVVVVTGGAGVLGQTFVRAIAEHGALAIVADVNPERGQAFVAELNAEGHAGSAEFFGLDITSKESIQGLIAHLRSKYGRIDALVNNAYPRNSRYGRKFEEVEFSDFCENLNLHLGGYFLTSQQFALYFKEQGHGNIVTLSSIYGVIAPRFEVYEGTSMTMPVEYAAIKSALIHLNQYMVKYFKGSPIRFNCLSPGGILDAQPQGFIEAYGKLAQSKGMLERQDLSGALVFLLSDLSRYVSGQNIIVDDGWTC